MPWPARSDCSRTRRGTPGATARARGAARHTVCVLRRAGDAAALLHRRGPVLDAHRGLRLAQRVRAAGRARGRPLPRPAAAADPGAVALEAVALKSVPRAAGLLIDAHDLSRLGHELALGLGQGVGVLGVQAVVRVRTEMAARPPVRGAGRLPGRVVASAGPPHQPAQPGGAILGCHLYSLFLPKGEATTGSIDATSTWN